MDEQTTLVVAPATGARTELLEYLRSRGYVCVVAGTAGEAMAPLQHRNFRFTFVDLEVPGGDAGDLIRRLKAQRGHPGPIIGVTGPMHGAAWATSALVATDVLLQKPIVHAEIDKALAGVLAPPAGAAAAAPANIQQEIDLWRSEAMRDVRQIVNEAAAVDVTVLITGETGTGKDVVARAIHYLSTRRTGPFVKVNCAAVPHDLLETELFGHERGAFTGAHKMKVGKFEAADGGTIFLDEIGDLHPALQAKLLHVLQDGDFARVGGKSTVRVDVRVIAATNQDLERSVTERRFREDLYYRLNVIQVSVPPLRERVEEIPYFVGYFVRRYSQLFRRDGFSLPPETMDRLLQHPYRGNVRELENLIKRMIVLGDPTLTRVGLPRRDTADAPLVAAPPALEAPLRDIVRRASRAAERDAIRKVLDQTGWSRVRAAKALQISYRALLYKMKEVGLREEGAARPPAAPRLGEFSA